VASPGTDDHGTWHRHFRASVTRHDQQPSGSQGVGSNAPVAMSTANALKYFTADHQVRASKVVGASVYNDQDQSIGSVDDVLMNDNDHKAGTAVISVGGFLGMGSKLVSVPFDQLKIDNDRIVMPGATKASLEGMPEYRYTNA
jgi:sporulation protein YlmC with PRC-barrel domain